MFMHTIGISGLTNFVLIKMCSWRTAKRHCRVNRLVKNPIIILANSRNLTEQNTTWKVIKCKDGGDTKQSQEIIPSKVLSSLKQNRKFLINNFSARTEIITHKPIVLLVWKCRWIVITFSGMWTSTELKHLQVGFHTHFLILVKYEHT